MSRKYQFWDTSCIYFISFAVAPCIDIFTRIEYKEELIKCWQHCQEKKGLEIYAWCIVPSYKHMLTGSHDKPLEDIVRNVKSYTSTRLIELIKRARAGKQPGMDNVDDGNGR